MHSGASTSQGGACCFDGACCFYGACWFYVGDLVHSMLEVGQGVRLVPIPSGGRVGWCG